MKLPEQKDYVEMQSKIEESCKRQYGKISPQNQNYIDGMMEGFRKGISWVIDNNSELL